MSNEKNKLDSIRSKQPNYPDPDYFERMAENVIAEHSNPFVKTPFYKKPVVRWAAAAAVVIPFIVFFARNNQPSSQIDSLAELNNVPQETIKQYIESQKEESVLLALEESFPKVKSEAKKTVEQLTKEINEDAISNYLSEEYGDWEDEESDLFD